MKDKISLSNGEWKLMKLLWEKAPQTVSQLAEALRDDTGWTKGTVLMMLRRIADKGAVRAENNGIQAPWRKRGKKGRYRESRR